MTAFIYGADDGFGVPARMLRLSNDFYGALGRIAALGAIVELRMSNIVVLWGYDHTDEGKPMGQLTSRFKAIRKARRQHELDAPDALSIAVSTAKAAMKRRNEVLHSLWPQEDFGWRNRPNGAEHTEPTGIEALHAVIAQLVAAADALTPWVRSPIDGPGSGIAFDGSPLGLRTRACKRTKIPRFGRRAYAGAGPSEA